MDHKQESVSLINFWSYYSYLSVVRSGIFKMRLIILKGAQKSLVNLCHI